MILRKSHLTRIVATLLTALLVTLAAVISATVPAPARASATAYDETSEILTSAPIAGMASTVIHRTIYLAAGNYAWYLIAPDGSRGVEKIYLKAGTYTWSQTLSPGNGSYTQVSELDPPAGAAAIFLNSGETVNPSGRYTWGSALAPLF